MCLVVVVLHVCAGMEGVIPPEWTDSCTLQSMGQSLNARSRLIFAQFYITSFFFIIGVSFSCPSNSVKLICARWGFLGKLSDFFEMYRKFQNCLTRVFSVLLIKVSW